MSLHADLLDQAEQLAQLDPRRPKQANLRRAISSAYFVTLHRPATRQITTCRALIASKRFSSV